ncbi:restriction endonuclease subunit S [Leeuwenhoekiella aequorea]|uniref:restriction endonuclease subunit S n=1 Tax=Leeuwenhoekiella aequorea TaxID=283736 RepID=UPI00352E112F
MKHIEKIGEIPESWKVLKAYRYIYLESGQRPKKFVTDNPNDIPSLGGENIGGDGFLKFENIRFVDKSYYDKTNKGHLKHYDVLINKDGANTGKIAIYDEQKFEKALINEHVFIMRSKDIDQRFLFYFYYSKIGQNQIQAKVVGSAQGGINNGFLKGTYIPKPPKPEQKAIAGILTKVDEAIKATQESIKATQKLKKALMQNLLTGKMKPDGSISEDSNLRNTKYGKAASSWRYCQIRELVKENVILKIQDGNHGEIHPTSKDFTESGIPFIMASDISKGFIDYTNCKFITKQRAEKLRIGFAREGDVLLSHKASLGYTAIVGELTEDYIMLTPQVTYYRTNKNKLKPEYLKYFFEMYTYQILFESYAKQSTRNYIGITNQKKMWFYYPEEIEEQEKLIKPLVDVDDVLRNKQIKTEILKKLKKIIDATAINW